MIRANLFSETAYRLCWVILSASIVSENGKVFSLCSLPHTTPPEIAWEKLYDLQPIQAGAPIATGKAGAPSPEYDLEQIERKVFELVNQQRAKQGKPALLWDEKLAQAARSHSQNMAKRQFFSHQDPCLGGVARRMRRFRIPWHTCGENIWCKQGTEPEPDDSVASEAVIDWMNSPGHRSNILNKVYTHTGIGAYYRSKDGAYFLTQIFNLPSKE